MRGQALPGNSDTGKRSALNQVNNQTDSRGSANQDPRCSYSNSARDQSKPETTYTNNKQTSLLKDSSCNKSNAFSANNNVNQHMLPTDSGPLVAKRQPNDTNSFWNMGQSSNRIQDSRQTPYIGNYIIYISYCK